MTNKVDINLVISDPNWDITNEETQLRKVFKGYYLDDFVVSDNDALESFIKNTIEFVGKASTDGEYSGYAIYNYDFLKAISDRDNSYFEQLNNPSKIYRLAVKYYN